MKSTFCILVLKKINPAPFTLLQEIPLSKVLQVRGLAHLSVALLPGNDSHSFELVTAPLVFCVQAGADSAAWESAICQALMPVQSSRRPGEEQQGEPTRTSS